MCGNNCNMCNWFGGNNWCWIIILILLFSCCGGNTYGNNNNWNGCGCDNDRCC